MTLKLGGVSELQSYPPGAATEQEMVLAVYWRERALLLLSEGGTVTESGGDYCYRGLGEVGRGDWRGSLLVCF